MRGHLLQLKKKFESTYKKVLDDPSDTNLRKARIPKRFWPMFKSRTIVLPFETHEEFLIRTNGDYILDSPE